MEISLTLRDDGCAVAVKSTGEVVLRVGDATHPFPDLAAATKGLSLVAGGDAGAQKRLANLVAQATATYGFLAKPNKPEPKRRPGAD